MNKLTYSQKMALTAGSSALLAPVMATAGVVHFDNSNAISVSYGGASAEWDVDGGGQSDFNLFSSFSFINLTSKGRSGQGVIKTGGVGGKFIYALNTSFNIGQTLTTGYNWGDPKQNFRAMLAYSSVGPDFEGASFGSNFIGFRFNISGNTHYGWAEIILATNAVTINQWAYDDTVDTAIHLADTASGGSVPEPSSLALLAMGAGGLVSLRRRKKAAVH